MVYDLNFLNEYCREIGLVARTVDRFALEIAVGNGAVLCFQNAERERDCLMGFLGTPWHTHGDLTFVDPRGHYIELDTLNLLNGLRDGTVLVCERHVDGKLADRWLIHSGYNDEFRYLDPDVSIIVRRANAKAAFQTDPLPGS
jgi:hypothetical protein